MDEPALDWFGRSFKWSELPHALPDAENEYDISKHLAGPLRGDGEAHTWLNVYREHAGAEQFGRTHALYAHWQRKYGGAQGLAANIVVPQLQLSRENDVGRRQVPKRILSVIVAHPGDAARLARAHVQKQPNFTTGLYSSIISTTDNEHWREQREELNPAFMPQDSLAHIFDVSRGRAEACVARLQALSGGGARPVDMNDFFLFETQAQLQLALFGEDESFMKRTNAPFRNAMAGEGPASFVRDFCKELSSRFDRESNTEPGCPVVRGPLARRLADMHGMGEATTQGNALIFAFAGHDTTGHTLTWLLFELCRHPAQQERLRAEVNAFWRDLDAERRPAQYADLQRLPFMTRCIMETLRLWPAVANGTFRQAQFDDWVTGPDGERVKLPKGTQLQIVNWSRHRNKDLWGADADVFNPDRAFAQDEVWNGKALAAYNPATPRFSPFTFPPRDCIGKNFAHLEMRLIVANLLRRFSFSLHGPYQDISTEDYVGVNYGTLAPLDLLRPELIDAEPGFGPSRRAPAGMHFVVTPLGTSKI